jgi:prophage regulatory protein
MKFLSVEDLEKRGIRFSDAHRWRLIKAGKFPKPVKLGSGPTARNAWTDTDIDEWSAQRVAERDEVA